MGIQDENNQECLVMGKGVAFGKKVGQTVPVTAEAKVYSLKEMTERGEAKDILKSVSPLCLEFANEVLNQAEQEFIDFLYDRSNFTVTIILQFSVHIAPPEEV